jgi:hypothetical protein
MQRQVERKRQLPAFTLSLGELEVLWSRVIERFDASADVYASITINLPLETLSFSNPEELRQYSALPSVITNFRIYFSDSLRRNISISSGLSSSWQTRYSVRAAAESEAWCAGAVETVASFLKNGVQALWGGYRLKGTRPGFCAAAHESAEASRVDPEAGPVNLAYMRGRVRLA